MNASLPLSKGSLSTGLAAGGLGFRIRHQDPDKPHFKNLGTPAK